MTKIRNENDSFKKNLLQKLYNNRLMRTDAEFNEFEESLMKVSNLVDEKDIPELCNLLYDDGSYDEVLFGIIHLIQIFSSQDSYTYAIIGINNISKTAPGWAKILLYRYLNSEHSRNGLKNSLSILEAQNKRNVINLLQQIKKEDPDLFESKINEIIR